MGMAGFEDRNDLVRVECLTAHPPKQPISPEEVIWIPWRSEVIPEDLQDPPGGW